MTAPGELLTDIGCPDERVTQSEYLFNLLVELLILPSFILT